MAQEVQEQRPPLHQADDGGDPGRGDVDDRREHHPGEDRHHCAQRPLGGDDAQPLLHDGRVRGVGGRTTHGRTSHRREKGLHLPEMGVRYKPIDQDADATQLGFSGGQSRGKGHRCARHRSYRARHQGGQHSADGRGERADHQGHREGPRVLLEQVRRAEASAGRR